MAAAAAATQTGQCAARPSLALRHLSLLWQPASAVTAPRRPSQRELLKRPRQPPFRAASRRPPCHPGARQPLTAPSGLPPTRLTAQRLSRAPSAPAPAAYAVRGSLRAPLAMVDRAEVWHDAHELAAELLSTTPCLTIDWRGVSRRQSAVSRPYKCNLSPNTPTPAAALRSQHHMGWCAAIASKVMKWGQQEQRASGGKHKGAGEGKQKEQQKSSRRAVASRVGPRERRRCRLT